MNTVPPPRDDRLYARLAVLISAARGYRVIANALGAAWLESPGISAFCAAICEKLLGEDGSAFGGDWWAV